MIFKTTIFVSLPKTAHSSIRKSLSQNITVNVGIEPKGNIPFLKTGRAKLMKNHIDKNIWDNTFKFSFIRNPYDRAVSSWLESSKKYNYKGDFQRFLIDLYENKIKSQMILWHSSSQAFNLMDDNGEVLVDFIGKYENLQNDYNTVREKLGLLHKTLPVINKRKSRPYTTFHNDKTIDLVQKLYIEDIERFGYKYED